MKGKKIHFEEDLTAHILYNPHWSRSSRPSTSEKDNNERYLTMHWSTSSNPSIRCFMDILY